MVRISMCFLIQVQLYMTLHSDNSGMTLIEVMLYTSLLSLLLAGFIGYAWSVHFTDIKLIHDIEDAYVS